jgi:type VI secretion system protein
MALRLEIISEHRDIVGDDAVRVFDEQGGTIGRSLQNDWILPDPLRYISGRHATIDYRGGIYYLLDTSTNGIYLNGDREPIGKGVPRRLFNGDQLRLGDFEIVASIDSGESLVMPLDETATDQGRHVQSLVEEAPQRTSVPLLAENELTGDDDFQSALFGGPVDVDELASVRTGEELPELSPIPAANPTRAANPTPVANPLAEADLVATDLLDAFLNGLGISRADLDPSVDLGEIMKNAGEVLCEFVEGTNRLLASRANLKNSFRLDQTTVLPRNNNPLKLSATTKESLKQLLVGREGEYLGPRDAVHEVCRDLLFHQDAFIDAMSVAFTEFADRFDPSELETAVGSNPLTRFLNEKKYWRMYCDLYPILTEKGSGRFPQMFSEEFVNAYELQIAEYKRLGGGLYKETVVLHRDELSAETIQESSNDGSLTADEFAGEPPAGRAEA